MPTVFFMSNTVFHFTGGPTLVQLGGSKAVDFVLQCLIKLPTRICVALANKVQCISIIITYLRNFLPDNPKSANAISSFPPTGYQPAVMKTASHVF